MLLQFMNFIFREPRKTALTYRTGKKLGFDTQFGLNGEDWYFGQNVIPNSKGKIFLDDLIQGI